MWMVMSLPFFGTTIEVNAKVLDISQPDEKKNLHSACVLISLQAGELLHLD